MAAVKVEILGSEYVLRSDQGEEQVREVACFLNDKLNEILTTTRTSSTLSATVLAALNIASELMQLQQEQDKLLQEIEARTETMLERIEQAMV